MHGVLRNSRLLRLITRSTTTISPPTMQLRSRVRLSSTLEVSATTTTPVRKRQSPKTTSSSKENEVRNGRNATRKRPATPVSTEDDVVKKAKSPKKRTIGRSKDGTPEHWQTVMEGIQEMRAAQVADVDVAGIEVFYDEEAYPPHIARFRVLISAMLSSQTKDPVNAAAMKRLTAHGLTVQSMFEIDEAELAQIIRPVGFFNNKAKYIKQVAQILKDRAGEDNEVIDIPNTYDDLVALPGVGPKMAHLIMSCAWKTTVGICVDTHVHRISNRLGWVKTWNAKNPKSQDPEKTRLELEDWLPREHWNPINVLLVGFGQTICLPRGPKCDECKVAHLCPSAHSSAI